MSQIYSDVDLLLLNRWQHVMSLLQAHRDIQPKIEQVIELTEARLKPWADAHGFEVEAHAREGKFDFWKTSWADKRREPKVRFEIGGFCPTGFRKSTELHPYLWVFTQLDKYRIKEPERVAFARNVRTKLGDAAQQWAHHDADDTWSPFGMYLTHYDDGARAQLVSSTDALYAFCTEHLPALVTFVEPIDAELRQFGL